MTTVTELKKLFIELGGNPEDLKGCQTDADVIKLLSEVVGSTIELPAVSDTDNGKVLKVIEGAWGKGTDEALPEVTADDNGKVLKVVEGAWTKGTDEALPEVTADDNGKVLKVSGGAWTKGGVPTVIKKISKTGTSSYGQTNSHIIAPELDGKTILRIESNGNSASNSECYILKRNDENFYEIYTGQTALSGGKLEFVVAQTSVEYTFDIYYID